MSYERARNAGIKAHEEVFPDCDPKCSEKCLQAQVDAYHKQDEVGVADDDLLHTTKFGSKGESPDAVEKFWNELADKCAYTD
jgi:hypothetical protein